MSRRRKPRSKRNATATVADRVRADLAKLGMGPKEIGLYVHMVRASQEYREKHTDVSDIAAFSVLVAMAAYNRPREFDRDSILRLTARAVNAHLDMEAEVLANAGQQMAGEVKA